MRERGRVRERARGTDGRVDGWMERGEEGGRKGERDVGRQTETDRRAGVRADRHNKLSLPHSYDGHTVSHKRPFVCNYTSGPPRTY